jgi:hypothetical protein
MVVSGADDVPAVADSDPQQVVVSSLNDIDAGPGDPAGIPGSPSVEISAFLRTSISTWYCRHPPESSFDKLFQPTDSVGRCVEES